MHAIVFITLSLVLASTSASDPLVQLSHGGQLSGKQVNYDDSVVSLFLGIPYAQAPVGALRFKKPVAYPGWDGVKDVKSPTPNCPQRDLLQQLPPFGSEDCLHLDVTVPGEVNSTNKKAVMVWIHGGAYILGSKNAYIGAPLAVAGDVIVVAINYRLGALGFLAEGDGGNFGLWDQREAIRWVNENIDQFGGDPDRITIFGESAGAGSVSAQMMSPHNEGLFQRGIPESGPLFALWSWHLRENQLYSFTNSLKEKSGCSIDQTVYDCLADSSIEEIFEKTTPDNLMVNYWHPVPNGDFFSPDIVYNSFNDSARFDLLQGFNGQEGQTMIGYVILMLEDSKIFEEGLSSDVIKGLIPSTICSTVSPLAVELCTDFLLNLYEIETAADDKERAIRFSYMYAEMSFNADSIQQLIDHSSASSSDKSTYAYYFTQQFQIPTDGFPVPDWVKQSADHFAEVPFVFGVWRAKKYDILKEYIGETPTAADEFVLSYFNLADESNSDLSDLIMILWSNFAKTGNPNTPVSLPSGTPTWPQFDTTNNKFMELNGASSKVITTPEKARIEEVQQVLFAGRPVQVLADKAPVTCKSKEEEDSPGDNENDEGQKTGDGNMATNFSVSTVLMWLTMLISLQLLF